MKNTKSDNEQIKQAWDLWSNSYYSDTFTKISLIKSNPKKYSQPLYGTFCSKIIRALMG